MTADNTGTVYKECFGNSFNGKPIEFMWKSPFLSLENSMVRKTIEEFYFLLDESYDNKFQFSVYKNFDSENRDDVETVYSTNFENMHWASENSTLLLNEIWCEEDDESIWALDCESNYKAEISEANYSIQLCVEGNKLDENTAIIGIEFKEVYCEDD